MTRRAAFDDSTATSIVQRTMRSSPSSYQTPKSRFLVSVILVMVLSLMGLRLQISPSHQQDYLLKVKHKTVDATSGQLFTMRKVCNIPASQYRLHRREHGKVDTAFSRPIDAFWNRHRVSTGV